MQREILIFDYLTDEATVIVPEKFLGTLWKIEVKRGDVKCSAINTPPDVQVYIKDRSCEMDFSNIPRCGETDFDQIHSTLEDGNCLFRAVSHAISDSEENHQTLRMKTIKHAQKNSEKFRVILREGYSSVNEYIKNTEMDKIGTMTTEFEMFALSHLLSCDIYTRINENSQWLKFSGFVRREFEGTRIMKIAEVNAPRLDLSEFEDFELLQIVKSRLSCNAIERKQRTRIILGSKECSRDVISEETTSTLTSLTRDVLSNGTELLRLRYLDTYTFKARWVICHWYLLDE
uniref:OTU domain-containing protein n=1 Tax=Magallana gigas TaxID=29159 RepID=A0A8W8NXV8_MAGGI